MVSVINACWKFTRDACTNERDVWDKGRHNEDSKGHESHDLRIVNLIRLFTSCAIFVR